MPSELFICLAPPFLFLLSLSLFYFYLTPMEPPPLEFLWEHCCSSERPMNLNILSACMSVHAKPLQCCKILWDPMDCSAPGSSVHGINQATIPEWVVVSSSRGSSPPRDACHMPPTLAGGFLITSAIWEHIGHYYEHGVLLFYNKKLLDLFLILKDIITSIVQ